MQAVRFHEHGGIDVLRYEEAPEPKIEPEKVGILLVDHVSRKISEGCGPRRPRRGT